MKLSKAIGMAAVSLALIGGIAFQTPVEASFGVFDMTAIPRNRKGDRNPTVDSTTKPKPGSGSVYKGDSMTKAPAGYDMVTWNLTGTIKQNLRPLNNVGIYVVNYKDGGETPKYHLEGNNLIFENISRAQAVSFSKEQGKYVSLEFKAPSRINIIMFAPSVGMRYFSMNKREYMGKLDYDFGKIDPATVALYHQGLIK